jgi:hypothetical protein
MPYVIGVSPRDGVVVSTVAVETAFEALQHFNGLDRKGEIRE